MPASIAAASLRDKGRRKSTPETSPTKTGWIWRMERAITQTPAAGLTRFLCLQKRQKRYAEVANLSCFRPGRSKLRLPISTLFQAVRVNAGHEEAETMRLIFLALVLLLSAIGANAQSLEEVE